MSERLRPHRLASRNAPPRPRLRPSAAVRRSSRTGRQHPWAFVVPAFLVLGVFLIPATVLNSIYPFTDWSAFKSQIGYAGLENFRAVMADGSLTPALRITLTYAVQMVQRYGLLAPASVVRQFTGGAVAADQPSDARHARPSPAVAPVLGTPGLR